ncbi:MAG TPA: OmpA family protein [Terriglobales bacterium]|nr:OmpA family protein [Terriglobales bacterium]
MNRFVLLTLALVSGVFAQQPSAPATQAAPQAKAHTQALNIGNAPTAADMYCSGFITSEHISEARFVAGGWNSPDQTRFAAPADYVYIHGKDMKEGDRLQIVRHVKDPNRYEFYSGQHGAVRSAGDPYFALGIVRVIDVQKSTAIAVPELACSDFVPGDVAVPFEEQEAPKFRKVSIDRFAPPNGKTTGRIIMAADFVGFVGTKDKVFLNIGSDKGLKVGDYLRATRTYNYSYHDPEAGLSLKASNYEDTQKSPPHLSDVSSFPRRTLGNMMVLSVHKHSATAMILTALDSINVGDGVELMDVENAPEVAPVQPASATPPAPIAGAAADVANAQPPKITCVATPATIRVGETSLINCDAVSPDNRPLSIAFVANGGKLSASRNQATLDTTDTGAGPIAVRATALDDRQLNATAITTVNVEAAALPAPTAQKLTDLEFKPNSAYVDNRSKAVLDDVALKMQQDPQSTISLTGSSEELEAPRLAGQRAENAKTYLTKSKGIDPARVQAKGGGTGHKVEIMALPAGVVAQQQEETQPQPPQPQQAQPPQTQQAPPPQTQPQQAQPTQPQPPPEQ